VTAQKLASMSGYAITLWNQRVERPGDDLISMLVNSRIDGEPMTREQYLGTFVLLVAAGNETTRNSIAGGLLALAEHPEQKRRLLDDPSLVISAASEIVRWVSPVMHMRRTALEPAEIGGQPVRPGDKVILWLLPLIIICKSQFYRVKRSPLPFHLLDDNVYLIRSCARSEHQGEVVRRSMGKA
jgi:cytochrome P450